jgi:beta-lactamase class D
MKSITLLALLNASIAFSQTDDIFKKYFDEYGVKGCFILYDLKNEKYTLHDSTRCSHGFLPASTFKVPNSLIFLECEILKDENEIIKWDSVVRNYDKWDQDNNLRMAIKYSTVWFYQECARRVGTEKMQKYVDLLQYGNMDISGGIDSFWLSGGMRISALKQLELLKNIDSYNVPFSKRNVDILKDILVQEKNEDYIFRAKVGWVTSTTPNLGWYIGWLETKDNKYFFAINIDIETEEQGPSRIKIVKRIFNDMGLTKFEIKK